jgi:hypothetical protein
MNVKTMIAAAVAAAALVAPATASASGGYFVGQREAQADATDAAEHRYAGNGVEADGAYCYPQGYPVRGRYSGDRWHRWTCTWLGTDEDGADVYGQFRITGHSNGTYGYLAVRGGLHWS